MSIEISAFGALSILLGVMVLGEIITKVTKGWLPSALVITVVLCAGFWTILPADLVSRAGITAVLFQVISGLLVANLGTLIGRKAMAAQWKTVLVTLMGLASIILVCLTIGAAIFGWTNAVAATPPICGAAIATAMVSQAAAEAGNQTAALIAIVCMAVQCLVGYPLGAFCLNKEARRLSALYKKGELKVSAEAAAEAGADGKKKPTSTNFTLFKLAIITLISFYLQKLTGGYISMYVWCLILGFLAHETKLVETDALTKANAQGLAMTILMLYLFGGLSGSSLETILPVFGIAITLVLMSAAAMALMAFIASKIFKESFYMAYVIVLNAFFGFPINVMLTNEAIDNTAEDANERAAINSIMMPKMLIAGFTSVTIVSVFIAGILIRFL